MSASAESYVYLFCADLGAMRAFYSTLLGLVEDDEPDDAGSVTYRCGQVELVVTQHPEAVRSPVEWAVPSRGPGGSTPAVLASLPFGVDAFRAALDRLLVAGVPRLTDRPDHRDRHWRFPVVDPMGNPIEIVCAAGPDLPLPMRSEDEVEVVAVGVE